MKINLEVLSNCPKSLDASVWKQQIDDLKDNITCKTPEWDIVELMEKYSKDMIKIRLLWKYIDNKDSFTRVLKYSIKHPYFINSCCDFTINVKNTICRLWQCDWSFCMSVYFKDNVEMFEELLRYFIANEIKLNADLFEYCCGYGLIENNAELFQDMVMYCIKTRFNFFHLFPSCYALFEKNLDLFKTLTEVLTEPSNPARSANSFWVNLCYSKCLEKFPALHEYVKQTQVEFEYVKQTQVEFAKGLL